MLSRPNSKLARTIACRLCALSLILLLNGCGSKANNNAPAKGSKVKTDAARGTKSGFSIPTKKNDTTPASTKFDGPIPTFEVWGAEHGLDFQRFDDISDQRRILEVNGGGVAVIDFDNDGWEDVFFTNGCRLPLATNDRSHPSALFRNQRGAGFQRIKNSELEQFGFATGCIVGDFDNDGFDDLYVSAYGSNTFWQNNGDGTFSDITDQTQTHVPQWSTSTAFADLNNDGMLDLYVVNYLEESDSNPRLCPSRRSPTGFEGCSPAIFEGVADAVFLNAGDGSFIDITQQSGVGKFRGKGLGVAVVDFDRNGTPEIYVANDGQANFLFTPDENSSQTHLVYKDVAARSGVALNESGYAQASMGVAVQDYDGDGRPDIFLTHFFGDTNTLYRNLGSLSFAETTRTANLGKSSRRTLGFGTIMSDFNNDGFPDLFVANGHVDDRTWKQQNEPWKMPAQIYVNSGDGKFLETSPRSGAYFANARLGRGVAVADFNHDGKNDIAVSHQVDPSVVLINTTPTGTQTQRVKLIGTISNRNGIGARISLRDKPRNSEHFFCGGGSFQSSQTQVRTLPHNGSPVHTFWPANQTTDSHVHRNRHFVSIREGNR